MGASAHLKKFFCKNSNVTKAGEDVLAKKYEQAFELFKESDGTLTNAEIAKHVGASDATVRKWKSRYEWLEKMGLEKSVTPVKSESVTKKEVNPRELQKRQVNDALVEAGTYSPALDLLIELYLDAYEEYLEDKNEKTRKELARLLGQLGLDGKNKELIKKSGQLLGKGDEEKQEESVPEESNSKLIAFRQRRMRES